jgi:hypothetical protein
MHLERLDIRRENMTKTVFQELEKPNHFLHKILPHSKASLQSVSISYSYNLRNLILVAVLFHNVFQTFLIIAQVFIFDCRGLDCFFFVKIISRSLLVVR